MTITRLSTPLKRGVSLARSLHTTRTQSFPTPVIVHKAGIDLMHSPLYNKGTAYPHAERDRLNLRGLVPPRELSLDDQVERILIRYNSESNDLRKNMLLSSLQDRNETLFYKILIDHIKEMAPIIYTPTVGKTCLQFGQLYRRARGMYFSTADRGHMSSMVYNWPENNVDVIVVTDGSRILGLGDLGVHGMAIPIGKLALYTAAGGIHPAKCLPVMIDAGTNNPQLIADPLYLGLQHPRITGSDYFSLIDEFMHAVRQRWPHVLVQFEDFETTNALPLLQKYRDEHLCFNDDIQGTGAVALAGVMSALRVQGKNPEKDLGNQRIVCVGSGSAGMGVIAGIIMGMKQTGLTEERARKCFWLLDKDGLLGRMRANLSDNQLPFMRLEDEYPDKMSLTEVIKKVKPTILLGLSGVGGIFKEEDIREMTKHVERPVIFPMSNPDTRAECTAEEAFTWSDGKAIVATGSPFPPVNVNGKLHFPCQANNMFIFPGVGLGGLLARTRVITDGMFYAAANALAAKLTPEQLAEGKVYPDISAIREVSRDVAIAVIKEAFTARLAGIDAPPDLKQYVEDHMYVPKYVPLIRPPFGVNIHK
eukprot:Phypoly_transcript_06166.p1 GENE.Phypoly_transcript_06166~~Phypoly_transcript_06166.p1  ORF type:complete len:603 (+),score=84.99 Phypoly_transcript_06166:38-1810(+)